MGWDIAKEIGGPSFEQVVVFKLGEQSYAIDMASVHEIILMEDVAYVPRAPRFLKGVINLRGKIIPVVDMRKRFFFPGKTRITRNTRIIILEAGKAIVGLMADEMTEILRLSRENIGPPTGTRPGLPGSLIRSVARVGDRLIMLLDIKNLFSEIGKIILLHERGKPCLAGISGSRAAENVLIRG